MCGRFSLYKVSDILNRFGASMEEPLELRYNIAPSMDVAVITNKEPKLVRLAHWGLIPHWAKEEKTGYSMINAKKETLLEKPAYKEPFQHKRCLVIADGFYEWKKIGATKVPYRFTKKDESLFAFAGLFDERDQKLSCTIITLPANKTVSFVHDRMPAILKTEDEGVWLSNNSTDELLNILNPYPDSDMKGYKISREINSADVEGRHLINPA